MKITNISYERLHLKLSQPYTIAYETVSEATNFILKLETDQGKVGYGCAAPDPIVTHETTDELETSINQLLIPYLRGRSAYMFTEIMEELAQLPGLGRSAMAMTDMALMDLLAKKMEVPLYQFLGGYRQRIPTSATIGICPEEDTMRMVRELTKMGFFIIKIKGGSSVEEDIAKMERVRKEYPDLRLRFDGNQGYTIDEAIRFGNKVRHLDIEFIEQPVAVEQDSLLGNIRKKLSIPLMVDESLKTMEDAFRLSREGHVDLINIKLMKVGGIRQAVHINSIARAAGIQSMVGCLDECSLGISAGLHFALSRSNIKYADLDGHLDLETDPFSDLFTLSEGYLIPSNKPGLGL